MTRQSICRAALLVVALHAQTPPPVFVMICIGALCNRRQKEQRSNQRALEMSERQSSYEPPVVEGERVPTPMGRVPPSKLDSPRGAVV